MFGAWQIGAWSAIEAHFQPDLVVGASVGSLNGYAIASGWSAQELSDLWTTPGAASFGNLEMIAARLIDAKPLVREYAVVLVDPLRMKPKTFVGRDVTARHLVASCAVPLVVAPQRIDGRLYVDGGLLNPLPVWAAVDLGATRIIAMNVLPRVLPSPVLNFFAQSFLSVFGHHPALPGGVELHILAPPVELGNLRSAVVWNQENARRWLEQGREYADQKNICV